MREHLNQLWKLMVAANPDFKSVWHTGLSDIEIQALSLEIPGQVPADLAELYRWRGGARESSLLATGDPCFFNYCYMNPLDVINFQPFNSGLGGFGLNEEELAGCFSPFEDGMGANYLVPIYSYPAASSPVLYIDPSEGLFDVHFNSLEKMIISIVECYKAGVCHFQNGYFEQDEEKVRLLCARLNPEIDFWKPDYFDS